MGLRTTFRHLNRQRNIKTKQLKRTLNICLFSLCYRKKTRLQPDEYNSVCIFMHTQAIGDGIVTSGFINALHRAGKTVTVVVSERLAGLFTDVVEVERVLIVNKKTIRRQRNDLKNLNVDLVVDFSDIDNASIVRDKTLFYLSPKYAIGFNQSAHSLYDTNILSAESAHVSKRMTDVLDLLACREPFSMSLHLEQDRYPDAADLISRIKADEKKVIIFNPFASDEKRCLGDEQIQQTLHYLAGKKNTVTIVFNMGRDVPVSAYDNILLNPFKDIGHSFSLVKMSDIVITVDTAIVHLASALNKRQFAIYNNRSFNKVYNNNIVWAPANDNATVLTTHEYTFTEAGDDMKKFDISELEHALDNTLALCSPVQSCPSQ